MIIEKLMLVALKSPLLQSSDEVLSNSDLVHHIAFSHHTLILVVLFVNVAIFDEMRNVDVGEGTCENVISVDIGVQLKVCNCGVDVHSQRFPT